ncbi:MAG: hypothetical protein LQ346_000870 [Caloplaca aetnensis]|nr:MAG: hypothetical protein LQ346_000870 [Caloplaca aetnensis]
MITNAAYTRLEDVEHRLTTSCNIANSTDLLKSYKRLRESYESVSSTETIEWSEGDTINDLNECWHAMATLRAEAVQDGFVEKILKPQSPAQVSLRTGPDASVSDAQCRSVLLYNVVQCIKSSRLHNNFTRLGSPVIAEVGFFMSHEQTPSNCMHCASGLSLVMSSYKSYSFALPAGQHTSNCRIRALRYAQGAVTQISAVLDDPTMPCRCQGTLAFHLVKLKQDFEEYLQTKMFDLFFQSPWVCGGQILEMMHALQYYGLRLAAYRSYMGSVVHMYNVLREVHDFPPIPVLESICEHLSDLFFPGGRPKSKTFKTCYVRYLGGRLRFHGQARHRNGCHELAIPAHTAKATAGYSSGGVAERDPRFDCGRLSLLYRIKERNYRVDDATWDAIVCQAHRNGGVTSCDTQDSHKNSSRRRRGAAPRGHAVNTDSYKYGGGLDHAGSVSATEVVPYSQALQLALDAELATSFPIASMEFFPLYLNCAKAVDRISNAYHGPDSKQGQHCLCYAEILVADANGCRERKGWRVKKEIRDLVGICGQALTEEFRGGE